MMRLPIRPPSLMRHRWCRMTRPMESRRQSPRNSSPAFPRSSRRSRRAAHAPRASRRSRSAACPAAAVQPADADRRAAGHCPWRALNWRVAMVRALSADRIAVAAIGLPVNLRGLYFEDVKSRTEIMRWRAGAGDRRNDREPHDAARSRCRGCASRLRNSIGPRGLCLDRAAAASRQLGSGIGLAFRDAPRLASARRHAM